MSDPGYYEEQYPSELLPFRQEETMLRAIHEANGIRTDLTVHGPLHDYLLAAQQEAVSAMVEMCTMPPEDSVGMLNSRMRITAYAHVWKWVSDNLQNGDSAAAQLRQDEQDRAETQDLEPGEE